MENLSYKKKERKKIFSSASYQSDAIIEAIEHFNRFLDAEGFVKISLEVEFLRNTGVSLFY